MEITWNGYSCFTIKTKQSTIVFDPYSESIGLKMPKLKADVVLISREHEGHNCKEALEGPFSLIDWPGEYEVKGFPIIANVIPPKEGTETAPKVLFFNIVVDNIKLCFLGDVGKGLNEELIEQIGGVDILFIPVGGGDSLNAKEAHDVVETLEPRIIIPSHYQTEGLIPALDTLDSFCKISGICSEPKDKFVINSREELSAEKSEVIVLKSQQQ